MPDTDIHKVLRHHDQQLASLTTEVNGVKATLSEHSTILREIRGALSDIGNRQGPGFKEILGVVALGGGVISMVAAGITVLVVSIFQPGLSAMDTRVSYIEQNIAEKREDERKELAEYRKQREQNTRQRMDAIEDRMRWAPALNPAKGRS